jgi:hypothetical protein
MQSLSIPPGGAIQRHRQAALRGRLRIDRFGGLFAARHEDLAVDAETTLGGFEDLHKKSPGGIGQNTGRPANAPAAAVAVIRTFRRLNPSALSGILRF